MRPTNGLVLAIGLTLLGGCGGDPEPRPTPDPAPTTEPAPPDDRPKDPRAAEAFDHTQRGLKAMEEGRVQEAVQAFDRSIELTPEDPFPYASRALAHDALGAYEKAVADVTRAIELGGDQAFVLDLVAFRGSLYTELERWAEGEQDLTRCIDGAKDKDQLRVSRAICLLELGRLDAARADAERVIERDPENARGWRVRGLVREKQGDLAGARADFQRVKALGSDDADDDLKRVGGS